MLRVHPGRGWQDMVDELIGRADGEPEWPPPELQADDLRLWERVVQRVHAEAGPIEQERFATLAVLCVDQPRVRLEFSAEYAAVEIPYWYTGTEALRALELGYGIASIVAQEVGGVAVDPRTGRVISLAVEKRGIEPMPRAAPRG